ncbi:hypothetical protein C8F01DRAFT_271339 [Mycena amicta]|nr:hypothetical protein C8F01DRAFT_271339 [Mycena amicta]
MPSQILRRIPYTCVFCRTPSTSLRTYPQPYQYPLLQSARSPAPSDVPGEPDTKGNHRRALEIVVVLRPVSSVMSRPYGARWTVRASHPSRRSHSRLGSAPLDMRRRCQPRRRPTQRCRGVGARGLPSPIPSSAHAREDRVSLHHWLEDIVRLGLLPSQSSEYSLVVARDLGCRRPCRLPSTISAGDDPCGPGSRGRGTADLQTILRIARRKPMAVTGMIIILIGSNSTSGSSTPPAQSSFGTDFGSRPIHPHCRRTRPGATTWGG